MMMVAIGKRSRLDRVENKRDKNEISICSLKCYVHSGFLILWKVSSEAEHLSFHLFIQYIFQRHAQDRPYLYLE